MNLAKQDTENKTKFWVITFKILIHMNEQDLKKFIEERISSVFN